jgi:iron(III) transport system substrate-binding protein
MASKITMNPTRRQATIGMASLAASTGLGGRARAVDREAMIAAAKKEGRVVVYSAYLSANTHEPINKAFEAKYGIKVENFNARGNELRERIRVEQLTGRFLGDVQHNALTQTLVWAAAENNIEKHGGLPGAARLNAEFKPIADDFQVPIFTINYGFLLNTAKVPMGEEPKKWTDLLDPKWKGKILFDDPRTAGGGRVMFHQTMDKYGRSFHEALAKQAPEFSRDYGEAAKRLARGEYSIYIPLIFSQIQPLKGLPVRYVIPEDGVTYGSYTVSILKNPPHPNAARLLADFYLTDEVQAIYANTGHGIVIEGLKADLSPEARAMANVKPLVEEDFTRIEKYLALAKEIYG